jgi:hypothetical protein
MSYPRGVLRCHDGKPQSLDQGLWGQSLLLKDGNKSDRIDAHKLADLLRANQLKPVYG